jgi:hypothetical protein
VEEAAAAEEQVEVEIILVGELVAEAVVVVLTTLLVKRQVQIFLLQ